MREVLNAIKGNAIRFPHRPAILLPNEQITYSELWQKVSIAWKKISALGLNHEKPIILIIDNPIRHTIIRLALMCGGYCVAAIRPEQILLTPSLSSDTFFTDYEHLKIENLSGVFIDENWFKGKAVNIAYSDHLRGDRIGMIIFTSGSVGTPKPIAKGFGVLEEIVMTSFLGRIPLDRTLLMFGLSSAGFQRLISSLAKGSSISFCKLSEIITCIKKNKIQEIEATPSQISAIIDLCIRNKVTLKLTRLIGGSAPISSHFYKKIEKVFSCEYTHIYSSTEASFIGISSCETMRDKDLELNRFVPISDVEIVDEKGSPVDQGEIGRVKVTSRRVCHPFDGKLEVEEFNKERKSFLTNDLGKIDSDGLLVLLGRADETINFGGVKLSPEIPEEIFKKHPLISDAGVVAMRFENSEQQVWLALVAPRGIDLNLLSQWYSKNTPGELGAIHFEQCFIVDQVPRGFNGKVLRQQLRDKLTAMSERKRGT